MSQSRKFTRDGFPKPNVKAEYKPDEVVWVLIDPNMPYWPAQVKIGGTIHSTKKSSSTKGQKKIDITTFHDPSLTVHLNEEDIINERTKKRKKDLSKKRVVARSKLIEWDALMKNGVKLDYDDVIAEYVKRKRYKSVDDIPDAIYDPWNGPAIDEAEEEKKRLDALDALNKKRKEERDELERARNAEIKKANAMRGQIWDGRKKNSETGKIEGWTLHAGDMIRYFTVGQMNNKNDLLTTKIIQLYDKYGTLRAKKTVPIVVEARLNPPFWDTEIELLPTKDEMDPIFWPLHRCKFVPGEVENVLENEREYEVRKWEENMRKSKFGSMMYNNNRNKNRNYIKNDNDNDVDMDNSNGKSKKVKKKSGRKRKRKRRLSDDDDDDDDCEMDNSDIQILNNDNYNGKKPRKNIINEKKNLKLIFDRPKKKKRKLNNVKQSLTVIDENKKENYINILSSSDDDDFMLRDIEIDSDNGNNNNNNNSNNKNKNKNKNKNVKKNKNKKIECMSEDDYDDNDSKKNKNKYKKKNKKQKIENMSEDDDNIYENSNNSCIPFPARKSQPKQKNIKKKNIKKKNNKTRQTTLNTLPKPESKLNQKKTKRKLRPNRNNNMNIDTAPSPVPKKSNKKKTKGKNMSNKKKITTSKKKKTKQKLSQEFDKTITPKNKKNKNKNKNKNTKSKKKKGKMSSIPTRKSCRKSKGKTGSSLLGQLIDSDTKCKRVNGYYESDNDSDNDSDNNDRNKNKKNKNRNKKNKNKNKQNKNENEIYDIDLGEDAQNDLADLLKFQDRHFG